MSLKLLVSVLFHKSKVFKIEQPANIEFIVTTLFTLKFIKFKEDKPEHP